MKRYLKIITVVLLALLCLTACSKQNSKPIANTPAYDNFIQLNKQLKKQKYITIDQFKLLIHFNNEVIERDDKSYDIFEDPAVRRKQDHEISNVNKIMQSYQGWDVVDDSNGYEYHISIITDGLGKVKHLKLDPVLGDDANVVDDNWEKDHDKILY